MVLADILSPAVALFQAFPGWLKFACFLAVVVTGAVALNATLDALQVPHSLFQTCTYSAISPNARLSLYQMVGYDKATRTYDVLAWNATDNPCLPCMLPNLLLPTAINLSGDNKSLYLTYDPNVAYSELICGAIPLDATTRNRTKLLYGASNCAELATSPQVIAEVDNTLALCSNRTQAYGCDFRARTVASYLFAATAATQRISIGNDTLSMQLDMFNSPTGTIRLEPGEAVCTKGFNFLDPGFLIVGAILIQLCVFAIGYYASMAGYMR